MGACSITKTFDVPDGCTLDFGTRALTLAANGQLNINSGVVHLLGGSLVIVPGGYINGRGDAAAPNDVGGKIFIQVTGAVTIQKAGLTNGRIDVSGNTSAGTIDIDAGSAISITGRLNADNLLATGSGGTILMVADGNLTTLTGSVLSATGGLSGPSGGTFDFQAGGTMDLATQLIATAPTGAASPWSLPAT
jgi:hypothetical protein